MQLRFFRFEGDIFQKMDFKTFIYRHLDLNYIEADALIEDLEAGKSRTFEIQDDEQNYSTVLANWGLTFDFGASTTAPKKTLPKETEKVIIETPALTTSEQVKTLPYILYYNRSDTLLKIAFSKILRECCTDTQDLKTSLTLVNELMKNKKLAVNVIETKITDFKNRIELFGAYTVAVTVPKKKFK